MKPQSINARIKNRQQTLLTNLAQDFSLEGVNKSPARFNLKKLQDINARFIRMMSLEEFAYRAQVIKNNQRNNELKTRITDIVYLVDTDSQKVFCHRSATSDFEDGNYHFIGGGREEGQTSLESIVREIEEETDGHLHVKGVDLKLITEFQYTWGYAYEPTSSSMKRFTGLEAKDFIVYWCKTNQSALPALTDPDAGHTYDWVDVTEVLASNNHLTYPIYKEFCIQNDLAYPQPTPEIIKQYCAWWLDKNRIITLSEFGSESRCVLKWKKPAPEEVQWKKSSLGDSLSNLREISEFIASKYPENPHLLPHSIDSVEFHMQQSSSWWESTIKDWLNTMEYSAGDYLWPLRVALSGQAKSPSPFELLSILSQDEAQMRINSVIEGTVSSL